MKIRGVKTYKTPDGRVFKTHKNAEKHMKLYGIEGNILVILSPSTTEAPAKKEEIYFLPIFGLRLVELFIREMPESINEYYNFNRFGVLGSEKEIQEGQYWSFLTWILMRMPESHDNPEGYFMDIYDDFKRDLKRDMRDNNEFYGHNKSCTEYDKNYDYIVKYWRQHTPKEGYSAESSVSRKYNDGKERAMRERGENLSDDDYFSEPLYYHKTHGWGLALTVGEVVNLKNRLHELSVTQYTSTVENYQRGHQAIDVRFITPARLKPLGKSELILRPLLVTQGIFCPCMCNDIHHKRSLESTIQHLLEQQFLFKLSGDEFGSLKLINWPYNEPLI